MNYVIVTSAGYWGKGLTLNKAAKNANVRSKTVRGMIIKFEPNLHEDVDVDDMGGVVWSWTNEALTIPRPLRSAIYNICRLGYFDLKMSKGNLTMTVIPEE